MDPGPAGSGYEDPRSYACHLEQFSDCCIGRGVREGHDRGPEQARFWLAGVDDLAALLSPLLCHSELSGAALARRELALSLPKGRARNLLFRDFFRTLFSRAIRSCREFALQPLGPTLYPFPRTALASQIAYSIAAVVPPKKDQDLVKPILDLLAHFSDGF